MGPVPRSLSHARPNNRTSEQYRFVEGTSLSKGKNNSFKRKRFILSDNELNFATEIDGLEISTEI